MLPEEEVPRSLQANLYVKTLDPACPVQLRLDVIVVGPDWQLGCTALEALPEGEPPMGAGSEA